MSTVMRNKQLTVPFIQNGIHGELMITLFKNRKFAIIVEIGGSKSDPSFSSSEASRRQHNVCGKWVPIHSSLSVGNLRTVDYLTIL